MKRTLKAFGAALVGALALSAMATASASAQHVTAVAPGVETAYITGTSANDQLTAGSSSIQCTHATFVGGPVSVPNNKLSITPAYTGCKAFGIATAHVIDSGCQYDFTLTNNHAGGVYNAGVYLNCGTTGKITVTPTLFGFSACTVTFNTQTVNGDVQLENLGGNPNTFRVFGSIAGVTYTSSGGVCGSAGLHHDGQYHINGATVKAYSNAAHTNQIGGEIKTVP